MLEIKNLVVNYGVITALQGISLTVKQGAIVTLIGANGAGKTTTLRAISGLLKARGEILYEGRNIANFPPHQIVKLGLSHVPEGRMVFANLSVMENLMMGAYLQRDKQVIRRELDYVFGIFPRLKEREKQISGTLSGGEQQMLAIGRALTLNPKVLLLDEPTEGLAPIIVEELLTALGKITRAGGICSIIVEQNAQKVLGLADRAVILERGAIVHDAASSALKADPAALERHLGVSGAAAH
jgi:branched-chain amino acid transport system ATP-binding protein